ncbi:MAG: DUF917 domain-containing protein, partial [Candidatus Bathyarchaeia archaeon]
PFMFALESKDAIEDLVVGTTILGTGGGGSPQAGIEVLESDLKAGRRLRIVSLDEIPDESLLVSPYYIGSVAPDVRPSKKVTIADPFAVALESVERYFGRKVAATAATELGGGNTAAALHVASQLGIPMVDGDLLGRAGPELHQSTTHIFGASMAPSAVVSETGTVIFIERYADIDDYESLARYVAVLAGGHAAVIDTPLTKSTAAKILIKGSISRSIALGKAVRQALQDRRDAVEAVRNLLDGWLVFRGTVKKYEWRNEKGFLFGDVTLSGDKEWQGQSLRSWIKNEHIFAWLGSKPIVMPPDLIMFLDPSGHGITNDALKLGLEVSVVAAKAPEVWRTPKGLGFFGPRHFGFDFDYVPVERLVESLSR